MNQPEKSGRRKLWLFRLAAISIPLVLFALTELILRIAGVGYPTTFLLTEGTNLVENQRVTWRYFPPAIARVPETLVISKRKPEGTLRVAILGESAALGDPEPKFGFARYFEVLLEDQLKRDVKVINGSIVAINSHVLLPIARELAELKPDLWLIYMGNNEVIGPFGSGTVFGLQSPPLPVVRSIILLKKLRTFQAIELGLSKLFKKENEAWGGMEMFLKQQVRQDDPKLQRLYSHFQKNLEDIIAAASDAPILLATVSSNLRDCAPLGSLNSPALSNKTEWEKLYRAGITETNKEQALQYLVSARELDSTHAELTYRIAKLSSSSEFYTAARDQDTLRFRTDSRLNEIIRSAAQNPHVKLVDTVAEFGVPGREHFFEHVHFNFKGNYELALLFARDALKVLNAQPQQWLSFEEASARLGLTPSIQQKVLSEVKARLQQPPFTTQAFHDEDMQWVNKSLLAVEKADSAESLAIAERAATGRSNDWQLAESYGGLLLQANRLEEAEKQFQRVLAMAPHRAQARFQLGNLLEKKEDIAGAHAAYDQAIASTPLLPEAWTAKGLLYEKEGKSELAIDAYKKAIASNPAFSAAHQNLAMLLAQLGKNEEALRSIETAIRLRPAQSELYTSKATLLEKMGKSAEAAETLQEGLEAIPDSVVLRHALASRLLAAKQEGRALPLLKEILQLDAENFPALLNLGVMHAQRNDFTNALPYFLKATEVHPNALDARLNLGVCYGRLNRFPEARAQFNKVLEQDPDNAQARRFLERMR